MLRSFLITLFLILIGSMGLAEQYRLQPGDTLSVEVLEDPSLDRAVLVLPDGNFNFPFIGPVRAEGRTLSQVQAQITTALAPNFASTPTVFVGSPA